MVQVTLKEISPFLTVAVIDQAFKLKTGSEDVVKNVEIDRAAPAGSGLLGAVYRIQATGTTHTTSFVVKAMAQDSVLRKTLDLPKFFKRETVFFSQVLPAFIEVQKASHAREKLQNVIPICYAFHCDGGNDFLLMEDLRDKNCEAVCDNPSKAERDSILKTLAHFHAVSLAFKIKRPDQFAKIVDLIPEVYYTESDRIRYTPYLQNAIKIDYEALIEFEDPKSNYYKKFEELVSNDVYGKLIRLAKEKSKHSIITHGDAWMSNFLYNEGKATMIDFQLLRCMSPVADLCFIILLSSSQGHDKEYALDGIKVYHDAMTYYLKDMGLDAGYIFPWEDLTEEIKLYGRMSMIMALSTIPLVLSDKCDTLQNFEQEGVENIPLDQLWPLRPYKNYQEKMIFINALRIAVDIGLI